MKYRQKTKLYSMLFIINILFIIFYPKSFNFGINNVVADSESFKLKDGFETYIENKIYSQEESLSIDEYFCDVLGDCCDFTEDTEDFVYHSNVGILGHDIDFIDGILEVQMDTINTDSDVFLTYKIEVFNMPLIHYEYIEINGKYSSDLPLFDEERFQVYFLNQEGEQFPYISSEFTFSDEFQTYNYIINIGTLFYEQLTTLYLVFSVKDRTSRNDFYDFYVDYIEFWRNNITDYATQEGDSWDFAEEGDFEGFSSNSAGNTRHVYTGKYTAVREIDGTFIKERHSLSLDSDYYNTFTIRLFSNKTNPSFSVQNYDDSSSIVTGSSFEQNVWTVITKSFTENWDDNSGINIRFTTALKGDMYRVDYILITHNNLQDKVFHQSQDTSFYRASKGLYSYHHNFDKNQTFYNDFTVNLNSSIIIDIPNLSMFPQKIEFDIYSNSYFNISLFIGEEEFILFEKTNINSWIPIRKTINRENYLINETDIELYFKIYSENQFIDNYLEYFLDNLEIIYTEVREQYEYYAQSGNAEYNDYWNFNVTNNNLFAEPSGVGEYAMGQETLGCKYNVISNELFSRRSYHSFKFAITTTKVNVILNHYTTFTIDKEYTIRTFLQIFNLYSIPAGEYISSEVSITQSLYIDGEQEGILNVMSISDYFFPNMYNFEYDVETVQEDYNTIRVSSNYISTLTGNSTNAQPLSFEINTGDIKNALNIYSFRTLIVFSAVSGEPIFPSNPTILVAIERSITHSDIVEAQLKGEKSKSPSWDKNLSWARNVWNLLVYSIGLLWDGISDWSIMGTTLKEFFTSFKEYFSGAFEFFENLGIFIDNVVTFFENLFTATGSMIGSLIYIVSKIPDLLSGVTTIGEVLGDLLSEFFIGFLELWLGLFGVELNEDWINFKDSFLSDDWDGAFSSFGNILSPLFEIDVVSFWSVTFGGFFTNVFGFDFISLFDTVKEFFSIFVLVSTILIVIYLIHLFKLIGNRDWDRFRTEGSTIVGAVKWLVSVSIAIVKWLINIVISIIGIIIPF